MVVRQNMICIFNIFFFAVSPNARYITYIKRIYLHVCIYNARNISSYKLICNNVLSYINLRPIQTFTKAKLRGPLYSRLENYGKSLRGRNYSINIQRFSGVTAAYQK